MAERILREITVLARNGSHQPAMSLPPGKVIEILGPAEDERFIRIQVDGEVFEAFAADVKERCKTLKSTKRAAAP